jgi:beta-lactamase regulating signal transducer with metallopeptidase domain
MQDIAIESLRSLSGRLIGLGLMHSLWISLCAASAVALGFQLRPYLSHQSRYRILVTALLLVAAAPILVTALDRACASRGLGTALTTAVITVRAGMGESDESSRPSGRENDTTAVVTLSTRSSSFRSILIAGLTKSIEAVHRLQPFLVAAWGAGVLACAFALAVGTFAVDRMCREGRPAEERIRLRAKQLARRAGLTAPPRIIIHPRACEPFLCGLLIPVVLLPEAWLARCPRDLLDAILAHEFAHARRRDHLVNLAQRLVEIALFFSPAVHWLSRSLRRQREFCADALAVRLTEDPLALAGALELVARVRRSSPVRPDIGAFLGGRDFSLLPRIQELLGMMPSRSRPCFWFFALLPAAGIMALVTTASGLSQDQPAAITLGAAVEKTRTRGTQGFPTKIAWQPASGHESRLIAPARPVTDRQISYKIRYFDLNANVRRELFKDRPELAKREGNASA